MSKYDGTFPKRPVPLDHLPDVEIARAVSLLFAIKRHGMTWVDNNSAAATSALVLQGCGYLRLRLGVLEGTNLRVWFIEPNQRRPRKKRSR